MRVKFDHIRILNRNLLVGLSFIIKLTIKPITLEKQSNSQKNFQLFYSALILTQFTFNRSGPDSLRKSSVIWLDDSSKFSL